MFDMYITYYAFALLLITLDTLRLLLSIMLAPARYLYFCLSKATPRRRSRRLFHANKPKMLRSIIRALH